MSINGEINPSLYKKPLSTAVIPAKAGIHSNVFNLLSFEKP
ncbi:hypothetical protein SPWS13_3358 [Shewanella putrefaciens]|nr:hypothetical protein SPWS13_3358 [Shewanella putrefaciens]